MGPETNRPGFSEVERPRLRRLDELDDYKVAKGDPDVRGWEVKSAGRTIGKVDDLIIDMGAMQVRYMDVEIDRDVFKSAGRADVDDDQRHVLIPIGTARLDDDHDDVLVDGLDASRLREYPTIEHDLGREHENRVLGLYGRGAAARDEDFYRGEHFDTSRFWGSRRSGREHDQYLTRSD